MKKNRRDRTRGGGHTAPPAQPSNAGPKSLTVGMGGFDGLIHALSRIPLEVNRALPLVERGESQRANDALMGSLVKVELAKAAILGNLALNALKAGDVSSCTGFVDIALESLSELGLETTELGVMLRLVHENLPADKATGDAGDGTTTASPADGGARSETAVVETEGGKRDGE